MADYFRNQQGDFVDSSGAVVKDPATRLQIAQTTGGDLNKLPLYGSQATPQSTPQPQSNIGTNPAPTTGSNQSALAQAMQQLDTQYKTNNTLMTQRNIALNALYGMPVNSSDLNTLDPTLRKVIQSGDKNQIEMQIRLINDQVSGRANTLDQSMQFLVGQYAQQQQQLEQQRQDAISTVQNFVQQYGSNAGAALKSLYGPDYVNQLQGMGIDLNAFEQMNAPTVTQQRYAAQYGFAIGAGGQSYDLSSYNPSNPNYPSQISNLANQIGPINSAQDAQNYISKVSPNSPITGQMVMNAAQQYNVDPNTIMALMQQESSFGTAGMATSTFNPGNVGNETGVRSTNLGDWQSGVNRVAQWLSNHQQQSTPQNNIDTVAQGIIDGTIPPPSISSRPTQYMLQLEAALQKKGFNLTQAQLEWQATQKYVAAANSPQQVRLKQAIGSVQQGIQQLKVDANAWNAGGFAPLNAANMKLALNGVYGQSAQQIAVDFEQQSTIIQDELGQTFMGGNSPTDKALALAGQVLNTNWSAQTFTSALDQLDKNLTFRLNAINTPAVGGLGGSQGSYLPTAPTSSGGGSSPTTSTSAPKFSTQQIQTAIGNAKQKGESKDQIVSDLEQLGYSPTVAQNLVNINY